MSILRDEFRGAVASRFAVGGWLLLTVLFAIAGPFGSYEAFSFASRLLFWGCVMWLVIVLAVGLWIAVGRILGTDDFLRTGVPTAGLLSLFLCMPLHLLAAELLESASRPAPALWELAVFIFCFALGITALRHAMTQRPAAVAEPPEETPDDTPRLLQRLPEEVRGPVLRMAVGDHYVHVHTTRGHATLLMRFSDAIAEMDGADGLQVHRSHWVAASAVTGAEREAGKTVLILSDGQRIPVSRSHLDAVVARGLA